MAVWAYNSSLILYYRTLCMRMKIVRPKEKRNLYVDKNIYGKIIPDF